MKGLSRGEEMKFLAALAGGRSVTKACQIAGVSRRTVYYLRSEDPEFQGAWDDAIAASTDELEDHLRVRALDPDDKYSHLLLMFLLKKLNPEYRDKAAERAKADKPAATKEFTFTAEEMANAKRILDSVITETTEEDNSEKEETQKGISKE